MASEPQRNRANSIKHGLSSSTLVVLSEEHEHEYEAILRGFRESFQPQDATEEALVLRLAHAQWRTLRSRRVETGILHITAATERNRARKIIEDCPEHLSPHSAIAVGFMTGPAERWQMYLRYDGAISREFFRTLDMLTRLQKARQPKKSSPEPVIAAAAGAMSDFGIRSVSQMSAAPADLTEGKELAHESKAQKIIKPRRTSEGDYHRPGRKQRRQSLIRQPAIQSRARKQFPIALRAANSDEDAPMWGGAPDPRRAPSPGMAGSGGLARTRASDLRRCVFEEAEVSHRRDLEISPVRLHYIDVDVCRLARGGPHL